MNENTLLTPQPLKNFVNSAYIQDLTNRALMYIKAGYAIHFRGPAGTGKTTLAKHIASQLGNPMVLIHGDEAFTSSSLIGSENGYKTKKVVDNYISSVLKKEEETTKYWVDNKLTVAVRNGFTMIYDEFTRSKPEANNVLLSILEEGLLNLPMSVNDGNSYITSHPNFVAIFTSNPEEYAGVYRSQDALRDRMVTLDLDYFDFETEVSITKAKSGLSKLGAEYIVNIVRGLRATGKCEFSPTVRGCIMIARAMQAYRLSPFEDRKVFTTVCQDILASETSRVGSKTNQDRIRKIIVELIEKELSEFRKTIDVA
ncbi:MAG: gas vesicle protein GvpN [Flammeovirgaceae bacterium]